LLVRLRQQPWAALTRSSNSGSSLACSLTGLAQPGICASPLRKSASAFLMDVGFAATLRDDFRQSLLGHADLTS
jgi:hypothetical protein